MNSEPPAARVFLYAPQDFRNLCALARTLEVFGHRECFVFDAHRLVRERYGKSRARQMRDVSSGAFDKIRWNRVDDPLLLLASHHGRAVATVADRQATALTTHRFVATDLLLFGSESVGLPPDVVAACSATMTIPSPGETQSLNLAVAFGIVLFECHRQLGAREPCSRSNGRAFSATVPGVLRRRSIALLFMFVAACAKPGTGTTASAGGSSTTSAETVADACRPAALGLGAAKPVPLWTAPADCKVTTPNAGPPVFLRTDADIAEWLKCAATANAGLDSTRQTLVVVGRTLSPAGLGTTVFDDGKTLTLVSRFRKNCPDDPVPMPMSYAINFLLPAGAAREVSEASCTIDTKCR